MGRVAREGGRLVGGLDSQERGRLDVIGRLERVFDNEEIGRSAECSGDRARGR